MAKKPRRKATNKSVTLRDYFAAHAPKYPFKTPMVYPGKDQGAMEQVASEIARWKFAFADAMIKQRECSE